MEISYLKAHPFENRYPEWMPNFPSAPRAHVVYFLGGKISFYDPHFIPRQTAKGYEGMNGTCCCVPYCLSALSQSLIHQASCLLNQQCVGPLATFLEELRRNL